MRVATFNVQRGTPSAGAREAGLSAGDALEAAATELSELGLDVLALQDVDASPPPPIDRFRRPRTWRTGVSRRLGAS